MIVVKLGGSLFDHPNLGPGLRAYLESLSPNEVLLVPGGGDFAEAVRKLDRLHSLGEEASHWLALESLSLSAAFITRLIQLPSLRPRVRIADCMAFAREDEGRPGALPHTWDVTADSIAARIAVVRGADRLILLKSIDIPAGTPWTTAAERGWVDRYFPRVIAETRLAVKVINFVRYLEGA